MVNDVIGDTLSRIRNAGLRRYKTVTVEDTRIIGQILDILTQTKFIEGYRRVDGSIEIALHTEQGKDKKQITSLRRISKPGLRIYRGYKELKPVLDGYGIAILSTSKGLMTNLEARKNKAGGEVLCEIY